jgi:N-dimethylarginine dimethylaminohydrolase
MTELSWGRRYLMCRPDFYDVVYEINPWMHRTVTADSERAASQWEDLANTLRAAGAEIELQSPVDGLPDLVFTANAGVVNGRQFVPARFRHPERQGETVKDIAWFAEHDFQIKELAEVYDHEGAGDALPFAGVLLSGYRFRSDIGSHAELSRLLGVPVRSVELTDERLYHFDLTFCPLDDRRAIVAPLGWDRYGARTIEALVPETLVLDADETFAFCANSVVVGSTIIMPSCSVRIGKQLESWGFDVTVCEVDEFLKAGGGCRCLTLALDVKLEQPRDSSDTETFADG